MSISLRSVDMIFVNLRKIMSTERTEADMIFNNSLCLTCEYCKFVMNIHRILIYSNVTSPTVAFDVRPVQEVEAAGDEDDSDGDHQRSENLGVKDRQTVNGSMADVQCAAGEEQRRHDEAGDRVVDLPPARPAPHPVHDGNEARTVRLVGLLLARQVDVPRRQVAGHAVHRMDGRHRRVLVQLLGAHFRKVSSRAV